MPRLNGIVETSLFVKDVDTACDFYERVLGLKKVVGGDDEGFLFEVASRQLLLILSEKKARKPSNTPGGVVPACLDGSGEALGAGHVAFSIESVQENRVP